VEVDFSAARNRAFLNDVVAFLLGRDNNLLSFSEVQRDLRLCTQWYIGVRLVEVTKIVGSANRHQDFDRSFLPRQAHTAERWTRVHRAYHEMVRLPPPILLKVGSLYFVYDGHHRTSVARAHGAATIEADVIEYDTHAPLNNDLRLGAYDKFVSRAARAGWLWATIAQRLVKHL
jgi:hypothetical protein